MNDKIADFLRKAYSDMRVRLEGMTGERDAEREIAQEWEKRAESLMECGAICGECIACLRQQVALRDEQLAALKEALGKQQDECWHMHMETGSERLQRANKRADDAEAAAKHWKDCNTARWEELSRIVTPTPTETPYEAAHRVVSERNGAQALLYRALDALIGSTKQGAVFLAADIERELSAVRARALR